MSAMPSPDDSHFSFLEIDAPDRLRAPAAPEPVEFIELDLTSSNFPTCLACNRLIAVNERSLCQSCSTAAVTPDVEEIEFGAPPTARQPIPVIADAAAQLLDHVAPHRDHNPQDTPRIIETLAEISAGATANAAVTGIGSQRGGQMQGVGFSTRDGYITAIRNGVPGHTYQSYLTTLRTSYGMTSADIAALNLPGPMAVTALPDGPGIKHVPTGPSVFDKPRAQRAFVVAPTAAQQEAPAKVELTGKEMVAGAVAEGHHAIVAWSGSSGMTRGALLEALTAIGRQEWAPRAPNARAQAGSAIAGLGRSGLHVRSQRKGSDATAGEHTWTVGAVNHTGDVGSQYGTVEVRFKLAGDKLTFEGSQGVGSSVLADFSARMAAELYKSSDVTSWLARTLRWKLDGVRFGALGWLVPARHVDAARQLCEAVSGAGFGSDWVTGLPVATSDQLRDGVVRGLVDEVMAVVNQIAEERRSAKAAREAAIAMATENRSADQLDIAVKLAGDIGTTRAATHLRELRAIGGRVVAYGQVLGEARVDRAQRHIRDAIASLEAVLGDDYSGISARFSAVWDEIEFDRKRNGGVL